MTALRDLERLRALDDRLVELARTRVRAPGGLAVSYEYNTLAASAGVLAALVVDQRYQRMCAEVADALDAAERGAASATYSVDGEPPCSLDEFLRVNSDAPLPVIVLACLVGLMPGEHLSLDYGAGGIRTLTRVT